MKTSAVVAGLLAVLPHLAVGGDSSSVQSTISVLPACSIQCLVQAISDSPCLPTNQTCICTTQSIQDEGTACILRSCTIKEALYAKNVTMAACNAPIRDSSGLYNTTNITFGIISGVFFLIRMYFKLVIAKSEFWLDDWFIIVTFFIAIPSTVMNTHGLAANGLGKDVWTLNYDTITNFIKYFYIMEVMYFLYLPLLKTSLLLFYLRIFPYTAARRVLWVTLGFNSLVGVIFLFIAVFQCKPISYYWTLWDNDHTGSCLNINAIGWSSAALSIIIDIWMLAIPLSQLPKLRLHWKRKAGIALMFIVGTFVTVVSVLRLQSLVHFANSSNPTWDQWDVANWSTIEINLGIICACMPALRGVLVRLFPYIFSTGTTNGASRGPNQGGAGHQNVVLRTWESSAGQNTPRHQVLGSTDETESSPPVPPKQRVMTMRSYVVEYEREHDESSLVIMRPAPAKSLDSSDSV